MLCPFSIFSRFSRTGDVASDLIRALVCPALRKFYIRLIPVFAPNRFEGLVSVVEACLTNQHDLSLDAGNSMRHASGYGGAWPCYCWFATYVANVAASIVAGFNIKHDAAELGFFDDIVAKLGLTTALFAIHSHYSFSFS